jgi:hypothetical protein
MHAIENISMSNKTTEELLAMDSKASGHLEMDRGAKGNPRITSRQNHRKILLCV